MKKQKYLPGNKISFHSIASTMLAPAWLAVLEMPFFPGLQAFIFFPYRCQSTGSFDDCLTFYPSMEKKNCICQVLSPLDWCGLCHRTAVVGLPFPSKKKKKEKFPESIVCTASTQASACRLSIGQLIVESSPFKVSSNTTTAVRWHIPHQSNGDSTWHLLFFVSHWWVKCEAINEWPSQLVRT